MKKPDFRVGDIVRFRPRDGFTTEDCIVRKVRNHYIELDGHKGGWFPYRFILVCRDGANVCSNGAEEYEEILAGQAIMDAINKPQTGY